MDTLTVLFWLAIGLAVSATVAVLWLAWREQRAVERAKSQQ